MQEAKKHPKCKNGKYSYRCGESFVIAANNSPAPWLRTGGPLLLRRGGRETSLGGLLSPWEASVSFLFPESARGESLSTSSSTTSSTIGTTCLRWCAGGFKWYARRMSGRGGWLLYRFRSSYEHKKSNLVLTTNTVHDNTTRRWSSKLTYTTRERTFSTGWK